MLTLTQVRVCTWWTWKISCFNKLLFIFPLFNVLSFFLFSLGLFKTHSTRKSIYVRLAYFHKYSNRVTEFIFLCDIRVVQTFWIYIFPNSSCRWLWCLWNSVCLFRSFPHIYPHFLLWHFLREIFGSR